MEEDPFAALAALAGGDGAGDFEGVADLASLLDDIEESSSSLSTVAATFFWEEYGLLVSPEDNLHDLGIGMEARRDLVAFLKERVGLPACDLSGCQTFDNIVFALDKTMRESGTTVNLGDLVEPLEPAAEEAPPPPPAAVAAAAAVDATPNTRRKRAVEKGIAKFQGMTLRGRTPEAQEAKRKELQARLARKK